MLTGVQASVPFHLPAYVMAAILLFALPAFAAGPYDLAFSTYFGGQAGDGIRDVEADADGNIYVAGTTRSPDFPTTPGAYDEHVDTSAGAGPWGYNSEIFVAKFTPAGELAWSTVIGGPNSEEAYGLEIDSQGFVVVHGRGAEGSPVTPNVYQAQFKGYGGDDPGNPHNTAQNAYICKLTPNGSALVWGSFFGIDHVHRDLALDANDDIYVTWGVQPDKIDPAHWGNWMDPAWNANAFQPEPLGGFDGGVAKIAADGSRVIWATYLGGSDYDSISSSIDVDPEGYVYIGIQTRSTDIPTTEGALDRTHNGGVDWYVAKLTPDGSDIVYGTYIGDEGDNWLNTHNLVVDDLGNCYSSTCAFSTAFPKSRWAVQRRHHGGVDWGVVKLSPTGGLLSGTLLGGSGDDNPDGIRIDAEGNLILFGHTGSADFPVTEDALRREHGGQNDAVVVRLSPDLDEVLYATFLGGGSNDRGRAGCVAPDGSLIVAGSTAGEDWPTRNAVQDTLQGNGDALVARLAPAVTISIDPGVQHQTITGWEAVAFALEPGNPAWPNVKDVLFDGLADELGINRLRLEIRSGVENSNDNWSDYQTGTIEYQAWRSRRYATVNDNADPYTIDWSGYHFSEMDATIERIVNPLREVLAARGEKLIVNVNYVAFTGQITDGLYLHDDPQEYAEFVLATYLHLQEEYGWVPDLWEILLEPDNVPQWDGRRLGEAIAATAERLQTAGFEPAFVAPSNTNMGNAVRYFDRMIEVPGVLPVLREFSYHRYGGASLENLRNIAARAGQHNLDAAMLEWWSGGNGYPVLHEDLKIGNNSAWEQGVLAGNLNSPMALYVVDHSDPTNPRVLLNEKTKFLRQYYRFVRPGAVRIDAASQGEAFDPLAFINKNGGYVVVVKCDAGGEFSIGGLAAGTYGLTYTTASEYAVELPDQTIASGQHIAVTMPQAGVITIHARHAAFDGVPPSAPTDLRATEISPFRVTLNWTTATDNVAVAGYRVYRDGVQIGFSTTPAFEDMEVAAGTNYTYEVLAYDITGNESALSEAISVAMPNANIDSELLGYWQFNEGAGTTAIDSSGYGHHGTVLGATWQPGREGQALNFDGIGDYVRVQPAMILDHLEALTITAWIQPRVDAHWHVLDKGDGDKRLYAEGTTRSLDGRIRYTGDHAFSRSVGSTVQPNAWQHVAMVWSRQTNATRLYHNGREVRYAIQDTGTGGPLDDTSHPVTIGARGALGEVTFFNGLIDEVRLYKRALSPREIEAVYEPLAPPSRR